MNSGDFILASTFIVFLTLKLLGIINWSWWWVTAPLWIPLAIVGAVLAGGAVIVETVFMWKAITR